MSRRTLLAALGALGCLALLAPLASADYDPLASGTTTLTLDKPFLSLLKRNGVRLSAIAPARLDGGAVAFPVSGGKFDPTDAEGTVEHEGALIFKKGKRSIPLKAPQLKTTSRHSPLAAKVGGSQLKLATADRLTVSREGFGDRVKVGGLALSAKLATRLGKKLQLRGIFSAGQALGSALTKARPETVTLLGQGNATLTLDPAIVAKLSSLFVAVNPIFPAEHQGPLFTLPIFGGRLAPDGSQGTIETEGSMEFLQLGSGQLFWAEDWLDLGAKTASAEVNVQPSPPYAGKVGRLPIAGIDLAAAAISSDPRSRTITFQAVSLALLGPTAQIFNEVFAKPQGKAGIFAAGEALGVFSLAAQGQ
jgi:hypothetical protein